MECYQTLLGMAKNLLGPECGLGLKDGKRGSNETKKRHKASGIGSAGGGSDDRHLQCSLDFSKSSRTRLTRQYVSPTSPVARYLAVSNKYSEAHANCFYAWVMLFTGTVLLQFENASNKFPCAFDELALRWNRNTRSPPFTCQIRTSVCHRPLTGEFPESSRRTTQRNCPSVRSHCSTGQGYLIQANWAINTRIRPYRLPRTHWMISHIDDAGFFAKQSTQHRTITDNLPCTGALVSIIGGLSALDHVLSEQKLFR